MTTYSSTQAQLNHIHTRTMHARQTLDPSSFSPRATIIRGVDVERLASRSLAVVESVLARYVSADRESGQLPDCDLCDDNGGWWDERGAWTVCTNAHCEAAKEYRR